MLQTLFNKYDFDRNGSISLGNADQALTNLIGCARL